ncbi:hypothetical protein ACN28S_61630 [Cystobacter fuscus]
MIQNWKQGLIGACCVAFGAACGGAEVQQQAGDDVQAALSALGKVELVDMGAGNVPTFIRGSFGKVDTSFTAPGLRASRELAHRGAAARARPGRPGVPPEREGAEPPLGAHG